MTTSHHHNLALLAIVAGLLITVGAAFFMTRKVEKPAPPAPITFAPETPPIFASDPKFGSLKPKHVIVEFGDYSCSLCQSLATDIRTLVEENKDVQLIWKDAPDVQTHYYSVDAAVAAICAGEQSKYWAYHDMLLTEPWANSTDFIDFANTLELDIPKFSECLSKEAVKNRVTAGTALVETMGVTATPYFFIDGMRAGSLSSREQIESFFTK